jgi:hypothetical protein
VEHRAHFFVCANDAAKLVSFFRGHSRLLEAMEDTAPRFQFRTRWSHGREQREHVGYVGPEDYRINPDEWCIMTALRSQSCRLYRRETTTMLVPAYESPLSPITFKGLDVKHRARETEGETDERGRRRGVWVTLREAATEYSHDDGVLFLRKVAVADAGEEAALVNFLHANVWRAPEDEN